MCKRGVFVVLGLLILFASGCVAPVSNMEAFQPKVDENGGPKALYSITSEQVGALFPIGSTQGEIQQKYGQPNMTGAGKDSNGQPNSWVSYTYGRTYSLVDQNFNATIVNRFTTATLTFDSSNRLSDTAFARVQKFATANSSRDATDEEVAMYIGAPEKLNLDVAQPVGSSGSATVTSAKGWKLGADISELRSQHAAKTGYKGRGVYVVSVKPGGLASQSGIHSTDIIIKVNGEETPTRDDLIDQLKRIPLNNDLILQIFRQGKTQPITIPAQATAGETSSI